MVIRGRARSPDPRGDVANPNPERPMSWIRKLPRGAARPAVLLAVAVLTAVIAVPPVVAQQAPDHFDILIRHGRVFDGTGDPWLYEDIGIQGDRIAAVGDLHDATAATVIDATGLYVSPGFIDTHSHAAPALATPGLSQGQPLLAEGVTTIIGNPDGGGPIDLARQRAELQKDGLGPNVGLMIGHGSVREAVMGMADRKATPAELDSMRAIVRRGMEQGAFGLSSGLFYTPGSFAPTEEVIELAKVVRPFGGLYSSHIRDESDYDVGVVAAVDEVIRIAREAGIPGVVTHIKVLGPHVWGYSSAIIERIVRARRAGIEVWADQYPYDASSTGLEAALVPAWARAGGRDAFMSRLADATQLAKIRAGMVANLDRRGGADRIQIARYEPDTTLEGQTLDQIAKARNADAIQTALDMIQKGDASIVSFNMNDADVRRFMQQPWTFTCSDGTLVPFGQGVPHPRSYGTFPRKIRKYALEDGVITLPFAIHSMTGLPAAVFRIQDRGVIRPGAFADIDVYDLAKVNDPATYLKPHQLAQGMVDVLVNGGFAIKDGRFTGDLHGRVLHR
jgi:N-acyl-D-amino-acid deacylase